MKRVEVYFDGGIRPFPSGGYARCYGWLIKTEGEVIEGRGIEVDERDVGSCAVEFESLCRALQDATEHAKSTDEIVVYGDARAVVDMCTGIGVPQEQAVAADLARVQSLTDKFDNIQFAWIPRERNFEADRLGRIAFDELSAKEIRMVMMNDINKQSRRMFGRFYDGTVMRTWCTTITGKRKLSNMSVNELGQMLANICCIPNFIRDYANGKFAVAEVVIGYH